MIGAQIGARFATKVKPEYLRLALAMIVLLVALRMLLGLAWRPDEIYLGRTVCEAAALLARAAAAGAAADAGATKPVLVPDVSQRADRDRATASPAPNCCCSARSSIPAAALPDDDKPTDIVVVVKGPTQSILVREKEKVAGIWVNAARLRYRSAPSFYAVASSRPIDQLVDERTARDLRARARQPPALARRRRAARRCSAASSAGWST